MLQEMLRRQNSSQSGTTSPTVIPRFPPRHTTLSTPSYRTFHPVIPHADSGILPIQDEITAVA